MGRRKKASQRQKGNNMREELVTVDENLLRQGMSKRGAWSRKQLETLGVQWPLQNGWKQRLMGKRILASRARRFVELKDHHTPRRDREEAEKAKQQVLFAEPDDSGSDHLDSIARGNY